MGLFVGTDWLCVGRSAGFSALRRWQRVHGAGRRWDGWDGRAVLRTLGCPRNAPQRPAGRNIVLPIVTNIVMAAVANAAPSPGGFQLKLPVAPAPAKCE